MRPKAKPKKPRAKPKPKKKPKARPKPRAKARATAAPPPKPKAPPVLRPALEFEEETVCSLEFLSDGRAFIARLETIRGGMREHRAPSFTDLLELVAEDLREEFLEI